MALDEAKLREKLSRIEALFAGATTEGERVAAGEARRRIQQRVSSRYPQRGFLPSERQRSRREQAFGPLGHAAAATA